MNVHIEESQRWPMEIIYRLTTANFQNASTYLMELVGILVNLKQSMSSKTALNQHQPLPSKNDRFLVDSCLHEYPQRNKTSGQSTD